MKPASLGIIAHSGVDKGLILKILDKLKAQKPEPRVLLDPLAAGKLGRAGTEIDRMSVDAALILGGDGTFLWAAGKLKGTPLMLGINTGRVGYLAELDERNAIAGVQALLSGKYHVEERSKLKVNGKYEALNELVVLPQTPAQLLEFRIRLDDREIASFRSDGLIISTQTGSTGHALSVGGPVIHPEAEVYLIAPLVPFMREQPPLIVPDKAKTKIEVTGKRQDIYMVLDGYRIIKRKGPEEITVEKSARSTRFVRLGAKMTDKRKTSRKWKH